jgi:hypothetical protein
VAPPANKRDIRLDFFRGLALFCIFIDHIPDNVLGRFTLQSIGMSDAAEAFILISGYTAGIVYGQAQDRQGVLMGTVRVYQRVWQLYVAHVFLFMLFMAMVAHTVSAFDSSIYSEEFGAGDFIKEPDVAVMMALMLRFQPAFMDILPLYIVLLAGLPFALWATKKRPWIGLGLSFGLWLAVQFNDSIALPAYPGPDQLWYFNPFAWQFLFYLSAWFGWRSTQSGVALLDRPWLFRSAAMIVGLLFAIRTEWQISEFNEDIPAVFATFLWPLAYKTDLGVLRLVNVLALALVVGTLIRPNAAFLTRAWAQPFLICGRHSLYIFCLGILLSVLCHLLLNEFYGGFLMQLAVVTGGVTVMVALAAWIDWFAAASKRAISQDRQAKASGGGA